jgi:hypothetical protein
MSKEIALQIKDTATHLGWTIEISGNIIRISKPINSNDDFNRADGEYYSILGLLPQTTPGSTWGTDGSGIGAISAMRNGLFMMHKSGGSKRVLGALAKII